MRLNPFIIFAIRNLLTRQNFFSTHYMSDKNENEEPGLTTEEAKDLELDEQPKPTRHHSGHHSLPMSYNEEPGRDHKKGKGKMK